MEATLDTLDLATHTQARVPDGVDYTAAALRYWGHVIPITCMSRRNTLGPHQGYEALLTSFPKMYNNWGLSLRTQK